MNEPITLHIVLTPSDEVLELRKTIADLELKNFELTQQLKRCESNLMWEYQVNQRITDYCKDHDFILPKHFFYRMGQ